MADSLLFPVFGSITLLSIFLIFKYLGTEWINKILGIYCALDVRRCSSVSGG
jgi:minor histocompatibility antigen H13